MQKNSRRFSNIFLLVMVFTLSACALFDRGETSPGKRKQPKSASESTPSAPPTAWDDTADSAPEKPVTPSRTRVPKLGVILGPGSFRAFAHVGVLKELERARIPIDAIIGLEWGSLVAGLYALHGQINEVEWKLYKLEKLKLPGRGFLSKRIAPESIRTLQDYLQENLDLKSLNRTTVPWSCPVLENGQVSWSSSGALAPAVARCMTFLPLYQTSDNQWGAAFAINEAIARLRLQGMEQIVLVNVLGSRPLLEGRQLPEFSGSVILWEEVRRSLQQAAPQLSLVIDVPLSGVMLTDFSRRKEVTQAGEKAGQQAARLLSERFGF